MIGIFFELLIFLICCPVGLFLMKLFWSNEKSLNHETLLLLVPVLGACGAMCFVQILNTVVPVEHIAKIFLIVFILLCFYVRDFFSVYIKVLAKHRLFLLLLIPVLLFLNYPMLFHDGLVSIQLANSDIIYYLSTMDWVYSNSFLATPDYSAMRPYFYNADFILNNTRFGMESLGALFMGLFQLEAYEVFSAMSVVIAIFLIIASYVLMRSALRVSNIYAIVAIICISFGSNLVYLIGRQHSAQLFGMACLMVFMSFFICLCYEKEERNRGLVFLTAFAITATLTVYSEYCSYIAIMFFLTAIPALLYYKNDRLALFKLCFYSGMLSFILNPIGMFVAVRFNLNILSRIAVGGLADIDPFRGNIYSMPNMVGKIFGIYQIDSTMLLSTYVLFLAIMVFIALCIVIVGFYLKKDIKKYTILSIMIFMLAYLYYFRANNAAYPEMKHITTISPFVIIFITYFASFEIFDNIHRKIYNALVFVLCVCIFCAGFYDVYKNYKVSKYITLDKEMMALRDFKQSYTLDEPITIRVRTTESAHNFIYILKDTDIKLLKHDPSWMDNSKIEDIPSRYQLLEHNADIWELFVPDTQILWRSKNFVLIDSYGGGDSNVNSINFNFSNTSFFTNHSYKSFDGSIITDKSVSEYALYGPYIDILSGVYEIKFHYEILASTENEDLGFCDISVNSGVQKVFLPIIKGSNIVKFEKIQFNDDKEVEFRVFVNKGNTIKLNKLQITRTQQ